MTEYEQPVTQIVTRRVAPERVDPPSVSEAQLTQAQVGDVFFVGEDVSAPDGWHVCDGSTFVSVSYPDFVSHLGIKMDTFTLPAPEQTRAGIKAIVKVGRWVEPPEPEPAPEPELMGVRNEFAIELETEPRPLLGQDLPDEDPTKPVPRSPKKPPGRPRR